MPRISIVGLGYMVGARFCTCQSGFRSGIINHHGLLRIDESRSIFGLALPLLLPPHMLSMICSLARLPARAAVSGNIMFDLLSCKYLQICCSLAPCSVLLQACGGEIDV